MMARARDNSAATTTSEANEKRLLKATPVNDGDNAATEARKANEVNGALGRRL